MKEIDKINILVKEGEGLTVEFKEHFTARIDEDMVAFANTKGGTILIGVRDDCRVAGEKLTNDLKARINSIARNCAPPIIADLFHRMGKVERMGSGIKRMRELMRDAELKEPVFEMDAFFRVTFYRDPRYSLKADKETGEKTIERGLVEKGGEDREKIRRKYGENAEKIILAIAGNQFIKTYEIADKTKLSQSTIEKNVSKLKKAGILKRIGPDKGGHWEVVDIS